MAAALGAFFHDDLQLFSAVDVIAGFLLAIDPDEPQEDVAHRVEGGDERIEQDVRGEHRPIDQAHGLVGVRQGDGLRHHFAEKDVQIGERRHRQHAGQRMRRDKTRRRREIQARLEPGGERVLAVHA
jgi:hypothetical protein